MKTTAPVDWTVVDEGGEVTFRWGYSGDDIVAEWIGVLTLRASRAGEISSLQPAAGAPEELIEKVRHGVAAAFLRAQQHHHSLHASAVAFRGNALICVGASGLGKSTMAERMCRHPEVELLADDTVGIALMSGGALQVVPSEAAVWLAEEGSTVKAPVRSSPAAKQTAALQWVVSLVFDDNAPNLDLRDLRGGDSVATLLPSIVRFERTPALWARELDFVGRLVTRCRVVQASRSHRVPAEAVADALLGLLVGEVR